MKILIPIFTVLYFSIGLNAQLKQKNADQYFELEQYYKAAPIYEELSNKGIKKNNVNWKNIRKAAQAFSYLNKNNKSAEFYEMLNQNNQLVEQDYLDYILVLRQLKRYPRAAEITKKGHKNHPKNKLLSTWQEELSTLLSLYNDLSNNTVDETNLNSGKGDFSPVFYKKGIVFCSKSIQKGFLVGKTGWDNTNFIRLFYATKPDSSSKQRPELMKDKFFSRLHNGPIAFDSTGTQMMITKNVRNKTDKTAYLALFSSTKNEDGEWSDLEPFPYNEETHNVGHASFSNNQKGIYFTSDKPGGFGGTDIYYSEKVNGKWTTPINLGPKINTALDEMFPYMNNQNTLYFSSNGHFGLGGLDIFKIQLNEEQQKVTNLGYPINSSADDFGIIEFNDKSGGYFSSNRTDYIDRIYQWSGEKEFDQFYAYQLSGSVFNATTKEAIEGADISIKMFSEQESHRSKNDGAYHSNLLDSMSYGDKIKVALEVNKPGFIPQTINIDIQLDKKENLVYDFHLKPFDIGSDLSKVLQLNPIYYDVDKATLRKESKIELDKVAKILNENPEMMIELGSHTDCRQTYTYNMELSKRRAISAAEYLKTKIVNPQRIIPIGYGELKLINDCACEGDITSDCSDEEHQENRRTDFIIVKN
ncbi:hypothetical protein CW751_10905 [Brumimicrobium salinarum]|uniref:OmpA-like domain-containing protein n=1 Tax=Brumimicrobium salinarum TaxID=2058658 RepID=A0A2I0R0S0_9FLAO|nr:OmpA family protein [Brumimicrobium salinarum]PKR80167.1 hypothetical protein CW751_10905 [Brumimicrobium salinarum]